MVEDNWIYAQQLDLIVLSGTHTYLAHPFSLNFRPSQTHTNIHTDTYKHKFQQGALSPKL